MNKQEVSMIGFELVALAGEARSIYQRILNLAQKGEFKEIPELTKEANDLIIECHQKQTEMLHKEAQGDNSEVTFIMVHGQDHLMTTILLKELTEHILFLYKERAGEK